MCKICSSGREHVVNSILKHVGVFTSLKAVVGSKG